MTMSLIRVYVLIIWRISYLEQWQLAYEFTFGKVNYDDKTLLLGMWKHCSTKKELKVSLFFLKSTMYLLKTLLL